MPHAKHEERLKPPGQKFTQAARGWKKVPCRRCILSRYLVPSRGSLGSGFPNDLDAELLDGNTIISHARQNFSPAHAFAFSAGLVTIPTTLYRFEKKVIQSSSVCFSLSSRSSHSGFTSSAFVLVRARAREASWPANTVQTSVISIFLEEGRIVDSQACRKGAYRDKSRLSRRTCFQLHRILCPVSGNLSAVLNIVGSAAGHRIMVGRGGEVRLQGR
jgi:hypothetical protein